MPVHEIRRPPSGHGEVVCSPPFARWAELARENANAVDGWPSHLRELRESARRESLSEALRYSASIGVTPEDLPPNDLIVMTGHQPELYHPGIWVKGFLAQRLAEETGAYALDIVVDTDACGGIVLKTPCMNGGVHQCETALVIPSATAAYVQAPMPDARRRRAFREAGLASLRTLPAPALQRHFAAFCDALEEAAVGAADLGTLMTAARRRYERPAETDYLELLVSAQARGAAFRRFAASILHDAARFRTVTNGALAEYRLRTGARSAAQPFPDLSETGGRIEVPFWVLTGGVRAAASVDAGGTLFADEASVVRLGGSVEETAVILAESDIALAPRALSLTLYQRVFVADLFIHGIGGGRYDRATDLVIEGYYGIRPPSFAVASMTLLLPLGAPMVTDDDVVRIEQRLHRMEHNPDSLLDELEFDTAAERMQATSVAARKAELIAAIGRPGADRKALGAEIRKANAELGALLEPITAELREEAERLREERDVAAILTDRTYPYCLWDPREVMDKVR